MARALERISIRWRLALVSAALTFVILACFAVVIGLMIYEPHLGLVVAAAVPVLAFSIVPLMAPAERRADEQRAKGGRATELAADTVAGLRVLRGIGGEQLFLDRYRAASQEYRASAVRSARMWSLIAALQVLLFGVFLVLLAQVHPDSGLWPLAGVRFGSLALGLGLLLRPGTTPRIDRPFIGWTAVAGIGDVAANALFVLAARDGLLSVVGPLAALYPVSTVLLALFVDKERVRPVQVAGLGLAAAALVLTAV